MSEHGILRLSPVRRKVVVAPDQSTATSSWGLIKTAATSKPSTKGINQAFGRQNSYDSAAIPRPIGTNHSMMSYPRLPNTGPGMPFTWLYHHKIRGRRDVHRKHQFASDRRDRYSLRHLWNIMPQPKWAEVSVFKITSRRLSGLGFFSRPWA